MAQRRLDSGVASGEGLADLTLAVRAGRTRLARSLTRPPLMVQRALYPDEALPDMAFVHICNPTAGVLQRDSLQVRVRLCPGAKAHLTTQSATKVYAMPEGSARQDTCLLLEEGAYLEYLPDPLIPFRGARFSQRTSITVAAGAVLVYGEILAAGRAALGESLAYACLESLLTISRPDGSPIYHESFAIAPGSRSPLGRGVLGLSESPGSSGLSPQTQAPVLGTLLLVADGLDIATLRHRSGESPGARYGASGLPGGQGIGLKVLAQDVASAQTVLRLAWAAARQQLLGVGLPPLRKY